VTNNITAFFEERLRTVIMSVKPTGSSANGRESESANRDSQMGDTESIREALLNHASQSRPPSQAVSVDDASSDGGYEQNRKWRHSRQRAFPQEDNIKAPTLTHWSSFPILNTASTSSSVPAIIRRQNTLPWDQTLAQTASSSTTSVVAIPTMAGKPQVPLVNN